MNTDTPDMLSTTDPAMRSVTPNELETNDPILNMDADLTALGLELTDEANLSGYNDDGDAISTEDLRRILEESPEDIDPELDYHSSSDSDTDEDEEPAENEALNPGNSTKWSYISRTANVTNFEKTSGLLMGGRIEDPMKFFDVLFSSSLLVFLASNINRCAKILLEANEKLYARITKWKDITTSELRVFLGLLFHMGTIRLNRFDDYWSTDEQFGLKYFSNNMARDRWLMILRCLNFYDERVGENRLNKISGLVDIFNKIMREIYYPGKVLCIDESLVLWRGRLSFRQFMKGKAKKYGVKLYLLTDQYGCVLKIVVYGGKCDLELGGKNHVNKVVKNLLQGKLGVGHAVYMDNYYNSIELVEYLIECNTYVTGTLRSNRKGNPTELIKKKLKKQEKLSMFNDSGICVTKWNDRREDLMISSEHNSEFENYTGSNNVTKTKPRVVLKYNKHMGGVDKHDQMMAYYNPEHKTLRWYKKLGVHIFSTIICNAHSLYNRYGEKPMPLYNFRQTIIRALVSSQQRCNSLPSTLVERHASFKLPRDPESNKRKRKRCVQCWKTKKVRVDTRDYCPKCPKQPGLCQGLCFVQFHRNVA